MLPWRMKCSVTVARSLRVMPLRRIQPSFRCVVETVRMSPSHLPVEKPIALCIASGPGCGRPSIQIVRSVPHAKWWILMATSCCESWSRSSQMRIGREARRVVGGVHAALVFRQRDERRVPGVGPQPHGVGDRECRCSRRVPARAGDPARPRGRARSCSTRPTDWPAPRRAPPRTSTRGRPGDTLRTRFPVVNMMISARPLTSCCCCSSERRSDRTRTDRCARPAAGPTPPAARRGSR